MSNRPRIILLGASNMTRAMSTVVATSKAVCEADSIDMYIALGHGRSFGKRSSVLGRTLPGILKCGLWNALTNNQSDNPDSTFALITDIGNDVMYGETPETIINWVDECVSRLRNAGASRIIITSPPVESIKHITPLQFKIVKGILFPTHDMSYETAIKNVIELNDLVIKLARERDLYVVEHKKEWYGYDPIHILMWQWKEAWAEILIPWNDEFDEHRLHLVTPSMRRKFAMVMARAERWGRFSMNFSRLQPSVRLSCGTLLSLY